MFQKQEYLKFLERSKIFLPRGSQKLVDVAAPSVVFFLIAKFTGPDKFLLKII